MADFAVKKSSAKKLKNNGNGYAGSHKTVYDDVFGGPPKFGVPSLNPSSGSSQIVDDYSEIFGSFNSSRVSSIPILDLPVVDEKEVGSIDVRSSKFDYSEVFGGFNGLDFAVSYEELLAEEPKGGGGESSSDDAWTSADTGSPSEGSSEDPACSETNHTFSIEQSYESEGTKQFNVLYQKSNQISRDDERTATTHIAQLNSVPAFTFLVDESLSSQKAEKDNSLDQVTKLHSLDLDLGDHVTEGKDLKEIVSDQPVYDDITQISESDAKHQASHLKETISYQPFFPAVREPSESDSVHQRNPLKETILLQPVSHATRQVSEGDSIHPKKHLKDTSLGQSVTVNHIPERALEPHGKPGGNASQPSKGFVTVAEINLRTNPCHVPPPSRPPPKISIWRGDSKIYTASHPRASEKSVLQRAVTDGSPQFFDVEVDASSSAEASAAAMKEAMDIAQARLKSAKELMERKKDGLQNRKKMGLKGESKFIEKREWETAPQAQCLNEKPNDTSEHADKEIKGFNLEERAEASRVVEVGKDWRVTGEKLVNASEEMAEQNYGEETGSTQASHGDEEEIGEWKVEEQYYELVQTVIPRAVMETSKHENVEDLKSTQRDPEVAHDENAIAAHELRMREEYEKESNVAQEVCNGERNDDHYNLKLKNEDDEKKLKESSDESVPKLAQTHVLEDNEQVQREERKREESEEREKMAREREEREKRLEEAREQEENERRQIEAHEREQSEKRLKESLEREEDAKRLKEAQELEEKRREEAREHEEKENERRLKEELEREETEKKLKEAREREVIEKKLKETREKEDTERRLREAHEREENERRLIEVCEREEFETREREENERRLKEAREQEEYERRQEELKREENEKNVKAAQEAREQEENERRQEELKREENEKNVKAAQEAREQEENERRREELKREEYERNVKAAQEAREQEENERIQQELKRELNEKNVKEAQEPCKQKKDTNIVQMSSEPDVEKIREVARGTKLQDSEKNFAEVQAVVLQEKAERSKVSAGALEQEEKNCAALRKKPLVENGRKLEATNPTNIMDAKGLNVSQNLEKKDKGESLSMEEREKEKRMQREREREIERLRKVEEDREREREREKDRMAVERATREARERALADAREVERATAEARQRAVAEARERLDRASAVSREKSVAEKSFAEGKIRAERDARLRLERAAVERATAEARERAAEKLKADKTAFGARERTERTFSEKYSSTSRDSGIRHSSSFSDLRDTQHQSSGASNSSQRYPSSSNHASNVNERYQGADIVESAQRCKARLERHQRTVERAAKALAEKNMRDLLAQREQAERNRFSDTLDAEVRRWSNGKEGNLRALLSTLQYILGPDSGWHPVPLTEVITAVAVKKAYRKATLCVHPDKLQQRGATIQQKYICEKVFDLLKEAWNKFNSEER
ncbi:hypothetical protein MKW94_016503 [Papaver nudicaule]|uniref:J domain-containing protein n=1 Tax=Papaver nudicaule TaxID=74823 RepID=A0AA41VFX0_PAPNU|nr:hypothetical protein [Papaver nudicaule]